MERESTRDPAMAIDSSGDAHSGAPLLVGLLITVTLGLISVLVYALRAKKPSQIAPSAQTSAASAVQPAGSAKKNVSNPKQRALAAEKVCDDVSCNSMRFLLNFPRLTVCVVGLKEPVKNF